MSDRDPRIDPQPGDVLDDDPPSWPLRVTERTARTVTAGRVYRDAMLISEAVWGLARWRQEMDGATVIEVAP